MKIISGAASELSNELFSKVCSYRHKVFVETLGWELDTEAGIELDQFDHAGTIYVVAQDQDGEVIGCGRLLPTRQPYLLSEVFPQLLKGAAPPCHPEIWELSRFAAMDFNKKSDSVLDQVSSSIAVKLLQASIACAARLGAKRLVTVSPIGMERWLRRGGFITQRLAPPMKVDGHALFACLIEVQKSPPILAGELPFLNHQATARMSERPHWQGARSAHSELSQA
uniref:Acyl-homoserine-lactone synthase n=2 Tax=unclassified Collimonas TaxID=2634148 RepID=D7F7J8_9BURK|nr:putative autoinducer synthesis protein [Collimonas sp. MPS11E8]BAU61364.1 autoinducer synthesis protein [Collimonas sp. NBRC 3740]